MSSTLIGPFFQPLIRQLQAQAAAGGVLTGALEMAELSATGPGDRFIPSPGQPKILVVDDDNLVRRSMFRTLQRTLSLAPEDLLEAWDVASGIQVFDANRDLLQAVFTDMRMPDGFGLEVYYHVREYSEQTPVVFSSGGMPNNVRDELDRILDRDARARFYLKPNFPIQEIVLWLRGIWGGALT